MGIPTLICTETATNNTSVDITSGITSAYDHYMFVCTDLNPVTDAADFTFQVNVSGETGFNEQITTTLMEAEHGESNSPAAITYKGSHDQNAGTGYQPLTLAGGNGADESYAGILHLFSPSSTVFAKQFYARFVGMESNSEAHDVYTAGYFEVTGAVDEISFKMSGGNFDGVIQMFGIA